MKISRNLIAKIVFFISFSFSPFAWSVTHPHIIVKESEYPALRTRASNWPWSVMKAKAIRDANNLKYRSYKSYGDICIQAHDIASACALAYILDPDNHSTYVNKIVSDVSPAIERIRTEKGTKEDHVYNVIAAHAAFMVYIAMDIMYNDLSPDIRRAIEDDCDYITDYHHHAHRSSEYSIKAMKELYYDGKSESFLYYKNLYRDYVLSLTSEDGVYTTGPGYAKSRLFMDNRMQKKIFMDICEVQGYHEFYSNPRLKMLYEWVFGYSVTPFNRTYTFGDSPPTKSLDHWAVSALRANRFSGKAQRYAAWWLGPLTDDYIQGRLLHYILCDSIPKPALQPKSRIFKNSGAWLLEDSDSPKALAGALWNINTKESSHNHFDVNAIHIAAYGAHVLRNSGYDGYGKPDPATWDWIHRTAESSNTVLIDGHNHQTWRGGGISEAFTGGNIEYASASSGNALLLGKHQRNFFFIKPEEQINNGYFMTIDEVEAGFIWSDVNPINVVWHPNSKAEPEINGHEYRWPIQGCNYGGSNVGLSLFLATPPESVAVRKGYLGSYASCSRFVGEYLYGSYKMKGNRGAIVTIIFPYDASGAKIDHGDSVSDFVLACPEISHINWNAISFTGQAALWREYRGKLESYFVRRGTAFDDGSLPRQGFVADSLVTIYLNGKDGQVISPDCKVTFYYPALEGVLVDGQPVSAIDAGPDWVTVQIDSGTHRIQLKSEYTHIFLVQGKEIKKFQLWQNYPNPFNNSTIIHYSIAKPVHVRLDIYNIKGQLVETLINGIQAAGLYRVRWEADQYARGIYFYRIETNGFRDMKKLILQ